MKLFIDDNKYKKVETYSDHLPKGVNGGLSKAKHPPASGRSLFTKHFEELVYQWVITKK